MTSRPRSWITPSTSFRETKTGTREKAAGWIGREENPAKPAYLRPAGPRIPTTKSKAARFYLAVVNDRPKAYSPEECVEGEFLELRMRLCE
jgi:hypothetical protein